MPLPASVESKLRSLPEAQQAGVRMALPSRTDLPEDAPYEEVLLAILQLGNGDVDRIRSHAAAASRDWRDVLYWSKQPRDPAEPRSWEELRMRLRRTDL